MFNWSVIVTLVTIWLWDWLLSFMLTFVDSVILIHPNCKNNYALCTFNINFGRFLTNLFMQRNRGLDKINSFRVINKWLKLKNEAQEMCSPEETEGPELLTGWEIMSYRQDRPIWETETMRNLELCGWQLFILVMNSKLSWGLKFSLCSATWPTTQSGLVCFICVENKEE